MWCMIICGLAPEVDPPKGIPQEAYFVEEKIHCQELLGFQSIFNTILVDSNQKI